MSTISYFWYAIPLTLLILFFIAYHHNRTWLLTGFLLSCSIALSMGIFFLQAYYGNSQILRILSVIPLAVVVFSMTIGISIFIAFLFYNTYSILKREKRDLKHILTLILAIVLLLIILLPRLIDMADIPETAAYIIYAAYGLAVYYLLHLTQFLLSTVLCNFSRPWKNQDYIIVLGCWIKGKKVTPILARRIDRAIKFYSKQKKRRKPPKLILSGGKGPDEGCSEAVAMWRYARDKGIPNEDLLLEARSASTLENMKFSKEIMDMHSGGKPYKCIYATSNYHLLRAGIFARRAGLKINGIGSKTAFYYLPNAVLREYIAYIRIHLKWNIIFGACSLLLGSFAIFRFVEWYGGMPDIWFFGI